MTVREGALVLADGSVFEGDLVGADRPIAAGEVVFNTVLSGYQEVITDPSYAGQIITFTNPHIGNYGVNDTDFESRGTFCRGVVVRDLALGIESRFRLLYAETLFVQLERMGFDSFAHTLAPLRVNVTPVV